MKRFATILALLTVCAAPAFASNAVRISQVYGGGGGSSTLYNSDYIELFNFSASPVNIGGWAVEYGSPTGLWGSSAANIVNIPAGTIIQPCSYFLIQTGSAGTAGAALPVTADLIQASGPSIGQSNGKVAVFSTPNASVACGAETGLIDKVAFGTSGCPEVTAVAGPSNVQAVVRNNGGMADTDNNSTDFTVTSNPVPRNSSSFNPTCQVTPTRSSTWGSVKAIYR